VILENDLYRRADATRVEVALAVARQVIVLEHVQTRTSQGADMVLPAATFAEGDGTLVNNEGRAQRFFQVYVPDGEVQESWRWLRDLMIAAGRLPEDSWSGLDEVTAAMATALPQLERVPECAPSASFRLAGQKVPREPFRYSGRTAMHANVDVSEPKPPDDPDSALAFSMEGYGSQPPAALITRFWSPRWNSIQALNKFQDEVGGPLRGGDPGERLIQAPQGETTQYFTTVPDAFRAEEDRWLVVPVHHIFGSEELSMLTPGVAELAPEPYVALHPDDAARIQAEPGAQVRVSWGRAVANLPLRGMADLAQGLVGLPAGVLEQPVIPALKVVLKAA
jgi:NADH-quinone oxidoreductase subunit G